jgi:hypothetical protein
MPGTKPSPANACALRNRTTSASPSICERCAGTYMANDPVPMIVSVHVQDEWSGHLGQHADPAPRWRTRMRTRRLTGQVGDARRERCCAISSLWLDRRRSVRVVVQERPPVLDVRR